MLKHREDAYQLLRRLGAPERLVTHVRLVGEAADELANAYKKLGVVFDKQLVELGVAIHDAGKILYQEELYEPGSHHESAGETLLLGQGVQPKVARCCVTHANWRGPEVTLEECTVALADKLWKGKREECLELKVIDAIAARLDVDRWTVFASLDLTFEEIAADGTKRLHRSRE